MLALTVLAREGGEGGHVGGHYKLARLQEAGAGQRQRTEDGQLFLTWETPALTATLLSVGSKTSLILTFKTY